MQKYILSLVDWWAGLFVIVGALNYGLLGFFDIDLFSWLLLDKTSGLSRLIYDIIGLSGVWVMVQLIMIMKI